jgi:lipopolysaccharide transport system ATP-binding protein
LSTVIQIEKLSKQYYIQSQKRELYQSFREFATNTVKKSFTRLFNPMSFHLQASNSSSEEFWALKDINLDIHQGDRVGIIGRNGAGKSTLLKILSRITEPTSGKISIKGRVSSLLEVGTGFHPELTGRENIYLNGAILGMSRNYIKNKFDEIVAFAEVEKFIDTPVKHYSSGMYVRLAFAVAAHLEPEILIVDEVLAVGDAQFQKKSLGKMEEVGKEGRTVLFVSHNMQAISTLTNRGIVLSEGKVMQDGSAEEAINEYLRSKESQEHIYTFPASDIEPRITEVRLLTSDSGNVQKNGKPMDISIEVSTPFVLQNGAVSFQVIDKFNRAVMHLWVIDTEVPFGRTPGIFKLVCRIPKVHLYMGCYSLVVHFSEKFGGKNRRKIEGICPFEIVMYGQTRNFSWSSDACVFIEDCKWEVLQS